MQNIYLCYKIFLKMTHLCYFIYVQRSQTWYDFFCSKLWEKNSKAGKLERHNLQNFHHPQNHRLTEFHLKHKQESFPPQNTELGMVCLFLSLSLPYWTYTLLPLAVTWGRRQHMHTMHKISILWARHVQLPTKIGSG